jgi:phosphomevalonate kinase
MIDIRTSAPGKVIIAGEYAVLDGAAAICMAVDRRAHVAIASCDEEHHMVLAPGHTETVGRFTVRDGRIEWLEGSKDFSLLAAVWREVAAVPAENLAIILDSNEFVDAATSSKTGIGSSAALTVALTAALDLTVGGKRSVRRLAANAHRNLQGGAGSGADIACSFAGGIIEYHMGDAPERALQWPAGLHYALLWSGVAARTRDKLATLAAAKVYATRAELATAANAVAKAWRGGNARKIVAGLRTYADVLRHFDVDHELGIFDAGHAELADKAESCDVVYKPCGAGGGDLGIVIASDAEAVESFTSTARDSNFKHLHMAIEPAGLRRDGE